MAPTREVYLYDYAADFGLSGLAGTLCARATLRLDEPVVLCIAESEAEDDDYRLGADVRLLLDSALPEEALHTVWLAAVRRCFDPAEEGTDTRAWLDRIAELCPPRAPERDPYEEKSLEASRPVVPEEELRTAVAAEIEAASAGLELRVAVPGAVPPSTGSCGRWTPTSGSGCSCEPSRPTPCPSRPTRSTGCSPSAICWPIPGPPSRRG